MFSLDYQTLLLGMGFIGLCLSLSMLGTWASARRENFMLSWVVGAFMLAISVFFYDSYVHSPAPWLAALAFAFVILGLGGCLISAMQFANRKESYRHVARLVIIGLVLSLGPMIIGLSGLAFMAMNVTSAILLGASGAVYWRVRHEAPGTITALTVLYEVACLSFLLCAAVLAFEGRLVLDEAPQNWAETLNAFIALIGMASIGALSIALSHARNSTRHSRNAQTDPLTGLMNRRALFDIYDGKQVGPFVTVAAFDLDHFKSVNDTYGHAVGDEALILFARLMMGTMRPGDYAVRLGGEEFALVMPRILPDEADAIAEAIRAQLAAIPIRTGQGDLRCTVSVGIASGDEHGATFADVLRSADDALYQAKRNGRDRVVRSNLRLVSTMPKGHVARSRRS